MKNRGRTGQKNRNMRVESSRDELARDSNTLVSNHTFETLYVTIGLYHSLSQRTLRHSGVA